MDRVKVRGSVVSYLPLKDLGNESFVTSGLTYL